MSRLQRSGAVTLAEAIRQMIKSEHITASHNGRRVFDAWDQASGAGQYTIRRFYRDGVLHITLSSSVICSQLSMQKDYLLQKINAILADDPLFISSESHPALVKELRLK